jgi:hypothetical protein
VIFCSALSTVNVRSRLAGAKISVPALVAMIPARPAPTMVATLPEIVTTLRLPLTKRSDWSLSAEPLRTKVCPGTKARRSGASVSGLARYRTSPYLSRTIAYG